MVPVKRIRGYGRFTARGNLVVTTQHRESLRKATPTGDAPMSGTKGNARNRDAFDNPAGERLEMLVAAFPTTHRHAVSMQEIALYA
jgi:hypothetical protein